MEMQEVESSNIAALGWDQGPEDTGCLTVRFKTGGMYIYHDIPSDIGEGIFEAESVGRYFSQHVRGKFEGEKQEAKEE